MPEGFGYFKEVRRKIIGQGFGTKVKETLEMFILRVKAKAGNQMVVGVPKINKKTEKESPIPKKNL